MTFNCEVQIIKFTNKLTVYQVNYAGVCCITIKFNWQGR